MAASYSFRCSSTPSEGEGLCYSPIFYVLDIDWFESRTSSLVIAVVLELLASLYNKKVSMTHY